MKLKNPRLLSVILAAMTMALAGTSQAKPTVTEIQGLPLIEPLVEPFSPDTWHYSISQIRSGADAEGNVVLSWVSDNNLYLQKLPRAGNTVTVASKIASYTSPKYLSQQDLLVNRDGSYLLAWLAEDVSIIPYTFQINAVLPSNPASEVNLGSGDITLSAFAKNDGGFATISGQTAQFFDQSGQAQTTPKTLGNFVTTAMNDQGEFILVTQTQPTDGTQPNPYDRKSLQKGTGPAQFITPFASKVKTYRYGEGSDPKKSVQLLMFTPKIAINSHGEILIAWIEGVVQSKKGNSPCVIVPGDISSCIVPAQGVYRLVAQRFNSDLSPKDPKPWVITSKNMVVSSNVPPIVDVQGLFLPESDFGIALDADGDFTLAYNSNVLRVLGRDPELMARQFITNNQGKLVAGKAIKLSSRPKTIHPIDKGKITYSAHNEPSIAITNSTNNEFLVAWHNDYQDQYQDPDNFEDVCTQYKKDKSGVPYCTRTKHVHKTIVEQNSALKAVRYGSK